MTFLEIQMLPLKNFSLHRHLYCYIGLFTTKYTGVPFSSWYLFIVQIAQIERESADSLQHLLSEAASLQSQAASSLEMITMLLQIGRPRHFDSFEAFSAWRQSYTSAVCQSLILGAAGTHLLYTSCMNTWNSQQLNSSLGSRSSSLMVGFVRFLKQLLCTEGLSTRMLFTWQNIKSHSCSPKESFPYMHMITPPSRLRLPPMALCSMQ